jgi:hypothetical protein
VTPPYAAELRVYEPLSAFGPDERPYWEEYVASGAAPSTRDGPRLQREIGLRAACLTQPRVPGPDEVEPQAYVLGGDGGLLVCPLRTDLRCWEAAGELSATLPAELAAAVLPVEEVDQAADELERWLDAHPAGRSHVLSNRWAVPVRWFLLFDREERRLQLGTRPARGRLGRSAGQTTAVGRSLVYRTPMAQARRRVARGLSVLRKAFDDGPVVTAVESMGRWLEEFHPRSTVELDYGGIVDLREDGDLRDDDSAGDVAEAIAALSRGDGEGATVAYDRVIGRWRVAHRIESAN